MGLFVSNDNLNSYSGYHTDLYSPSDYTIYDEGVDINYTTLGYEIVAESQEEWNTLMKQVALNELAVYSSNGCREVLYEATSFSAVFNKIKDFFKKLAEKVKAIFHSFMAKMSSVFGKSSSFAKKYGNEFINKVQNIRDDFEFKGYTFTIKKFSNRDDITFDSQLATIYTNKAKVGETKIDNSIVNLLNSRGSVSDSLLNPSTFVESVGYYDDYYVLNEYNTQNVTEYDKIYILHTYGKESIFGKDNMDYINNLYNQKRQITKEEKEKVNKIFDLVSKYDGKHNKIDGSNFNYYTINDLLNFLKDTLNKNSTNEINIILSMLGSINLDDKSKVNIFFNKLNNLLKKIKNNKFDASILNQYNPTTQASESGPSSSGSGSQQQQNSQTSSNKISKKDFFNKIKVIKSKLNNGSFNNEFINKFNSLLDDYKLDNDYFDNQVTELDKTNAEKYLDELEKFVEELNKRNPQSSSSGSTSNSGVNIGGSGSSGGGSGSGSGSVGGRNINYNSPAEKADVYKRANISIQDNSEDIHDTIRGAVAKLYTDNSSAADSYNERDFKNELFKLFRNGADKKDSIPASEIKKNASTIVDEVTTYKNTKDMAKESTNTVIKAIDSVINKLDEYIKRSNKNWTEGSDGTLTSNFTNLLTTITNTFFKTSRSDIVLANNIYLTALKDRCIQNKNIMVKVIAGYDSKKMKNTNESYDYGYDNDYIYSNNSGNSFLDNIIFK